jgi:hypothetical protein
MRSLTSLAVALSVAAGSLALPIPALAKNQSHYEYNGHYYETRQQCLDAKKRAQQRGTVVGAATAGVATALLGGNLGETALVAGGGARVGNQLGKNSKKC